MTRGDRRIDWRALAARLGWPGWAAIAVTVVAAYIVVAALVPVMRAVAAPGVMLSGAEATHEERVKAYLAAYDGYVAQIDGRTMFYTPPPPPEPEDDEPEQVEQGPAPKPRTYGGPRIEALVGDTAWFSDGRVLAIGDDPDGGLAVVSIDAPWGATVSWRDVEFDVELFERTTARFLVDDEDDESDETRRADAAQDGQANAAADTDAAPPDAAGDPADAPNEDDDTTGVDPDPDKDDADDEA